MQTENKFVFFCSSRCIFWVDEPYFFFSKKTILLKVRKSQKKNMPSWIFPKNKRWCNFMYWKLPQCSFFGRIQDGIICFWDLLTFSPAPARAYCAILECVKAIASFCTCPHCEILLQFFLIFPNMNRILNLYIIVSSKLSHAKKPEIIESWNILKPYLPMCCLPAS